MTELVHHRRHNVVAPVVERRSPGGELIALAGASGAGKTTLLRSIAGFAAPDAAPVSAQISVAVPARGPGRIGYVPQDDIVHLDLPLERVLLHAAKLRIDESSTDRRDRVDRVMATLGIDHRRDAAVRHLSGGERKRASIAVELLTEPDLFLLDEPTSGLDPASAAALLRHLRRLAEDGTTVVLTTHSPADIDRCDRVVFLAHGGRPAFAGSPADARDHFGVADLHEVYDVLGRHDEIPAGDLTHVGPVPRVTDRPTSGHPDARPARRHGRAPTRPSTQWWALTRRNADLLVRSRLTLAILLGSPALVVMMMGSLFSAGAFDTDAPTPALAIQETYWITFAGFFFGLTYGLLQIAPELAILRRDRFAGMSLVAYVASKVTVLAPILLAVTVLMLAVLRRLDQLPPLAWTAWMQLGSIVLLVAIAALTTGLLASAAVTDTTQATLALPLICFPQVLFAGSLVPLADMGWVGRLLSHVLVARWGFESLGRRLDVGERIRPGTDLEGFAPALVGTGTTGVLCLVAITVAMATGTVAVLRRRTSAEGAGTGE